MEVEATNPDVPTQQSSEKINNPTNKQKKEKNTTEETKQKIKGVHQSENSDVTKGKIQENNSAPSAHFKPIIHQTPKNRRIQETANKKNQAKSTTETQRKTTRKWK